MHLWRVDKARTVLTARIEHLSLRAWGLSRARSVRILMSWAVVGLAALSIYWRFSPQSAAPCTTDFYSDYQSSILVSHGAAPYGPLADWIRAYQPGQPLDPFSGASCLLGRLEFAYTPFFALILTPFTWLPYHTALIVWDGANLLMLLGAIFAFLRAAQLTPSPLLLVLITCAAVLASPLRFELYYAQADIFMLFFICLALCVRLSGRPTLAGLLLAVACASEPALLAGVLLLLWKRELRFAAVTLVSSLALIFLPFLWLGGTALRNLLLIWQFYANTYVVTFTNDALKGVLARLLTSNAYVAPLANAPQLVTPLWLLVAVLVLLAAGLLISRRPLGNDERSLLDVGLAVAALLLISPWSENNHFTLLIVSFLAVYVYLQRPDWLAAETRPLLAGFIGALVLFLVLGDPVQYALAARLRDSSPIVYLYVLLEATYVYPLVAITAAIIYAQRRTTSAVEWQHRGAALMAATESDTLVARVRTQLDDVRRIHIIGGPGSGKTALSRRLARLIEVPVYELDVLAEAGPAPAFRMGRPLNARLAEVEDIAALPGWITEGTFLWWTDRLFDAADLIIWLDIPPRTALRRVLVRHVNEYVERVREARGIARKTRALRRVYLRHILAFTAYTRAYYHRAARAGVSEAPALDDGWALTRAETAAQLERYKAKVIRCTHPRDTASLLASVTAMIRRSGGYVTYSRR